MDALITALAPIFGPEALKLWGSYAFVLIVLGATLWKSERRTKDRELENEHLRAQLAALQDKRVEDARYLIQLAETGNERMVTRSSGDQQQTEIMAAMALAIQDLRRQVSTMAADKASG